VRAIRLRAAKATLSAVVGEAMRGHPIVITRHGKPQAVIVSFEEWQQLSQVPSFGRLLMASPVRAGDLPRRNRAGARRTGL
jgi:antitoxin Phd